MFAKKFLFNVAFFSILTSGNRGAAKECISRYLAEDSFVCVCNSTYCDTIEPVLEADLQDGSFVQYETTQAGKRMYITKGKFIKKIEPNTFIKKILSEWMTTSFTVDPFVIYQEFFGFGGGLTDSVGRLIINLSETMRKQLLKQYFCNEGLNYSLIRMPMGSTDFSSHKYTYDDNGTGYSLSKFHLSEEDNKIKIPVLKLLQNISSNPIKIIATPWTAPKRMKEPRPLPENLSWIQSERLKDDYYKVYAEYFTKFLDAYKKQGVNIWAITIQNEPLNALVGLPPNSSMGWTIAEQGKFIGQNLGPVLNFTGYGNVKILALDEDWIFNTIATRFIMADASKYISGVAIHGYFQTITHPGVMTGLHNAFPDLFILSTEFSILITGIFQPSVRFGRWKNLEEYVINIITNVNNWISGWIDWNMVLSETGGPSFVATRIDAPIIINHTNEEFYKQPMWYGIAHFANFVPPGSRRIDLKEWRAFGIMSTAFLTPQSRVVVVLMNRRDHPWDILINVGNDEQIQVSLAARSLNTFIYQGPKYIKMDIHDDRSERTNLNPTSQVPIPVTDSSSHNNFQCEIHILTLLVFMNILYYYI